MKTNTTPTTPPTRAELRERHGTPQTFEDHVWDAWAQLFITTEEAVAAIKKYTAEYYAAI